MSNKNILFSFLVIFLGIFFVIAIPPFQKNDELAHYYRTVSIADGQYNCKNGVFEIPKNLYEFPYRMGLESVLINKAKFPKDIFFRSDLNEGAGEVAYEEKICNLPVIGYIPNLVGYFIGNVFTKNPLIPYYLGRIAGFLFYLGALALSLRIIDKKYRGYLYIYGCVPMILHQVTAFSYDVVIFGLIPVVFAIFINLLSNRNNLLVKELFFSFLVTIISIIKQTYFPLIFLLSIIQIRELRGIYKKKEKLRYLIRCLGLYAVSAILIVVYTKIFFKNVGNNYPYLVNPYIQKDIILDDPLYFVRALWNSIATNWEFYFKGFFGIFGWLDVHMSTSFVYYLFFGFLSIFVYKSSKSENDILNVFENMIIGGVLAGIIVLIFLSMYLVNAHVGSESISGVQGRYITVLFPFLLFVVVQSVAYLRRIRKENILIFISAAFIGGVIIRGIFLRYYDYSKNYSDERIVWDYVSAISEKNIISKEINGKTNIIIDTKYPDYKVSAFEYYLDNKEEKRILVPYRYRIMDSNCNKIYKQGYLKQSDIQKSGVFVQYFGKLKVNEPKLCIQLEPVFIPDNYSNSFVSLGTSEYGELVNFLYLRK